MTFKVLVFMTHKSHLRMFPSTFWRNHLEDTQWIWVDWRYISEFCLVTLCYGVIAGVIFSPSCLRIRTLNCISSRRLPFFPGLTNLKWVMTSPGCPPMFSVLLTWDWVSWNPFLIVYTVILMYIVVNVKSCSCLGRGPLLCISSQDFPRHSSKVSGD